MRDIKNGSILLELLVPILSDLASSDISRDFSAVGAGLTTHFSTEALFSFASAVAD